MRQNAKFNLDFGRNSKFQWNSSWYLGWPPDRMSVVHHSGTFWRHFLIGAASSKPRPGSAGVTDNQHSVRSMAWIAAGMPEISSTRTKLDGTLIKYRVRNDENFPLVWGTSSPKIYMSIKKKFRLSGGQVARKSTCPNVFTLVHKHIDKILDY